ncbi:2-C-methyl-D-erythritol 4-phosphate cytidylyltransferase [Acidihalobacter yilgarnensis]|uniref:2-C-methyl-D-erythritol 4-phosphate cytidylyltransferase n=1 Tax=Acidihalobacter yilgarnensis TaxID=2819280 RepID=A0A1D8IP38_9GAMM|nr:2-C-methyl-D-erythritol 4-phosphate cytidylyltransferase [Acidihalobacter yilgarnensis]AOU98199.1 2-C-methyl-D-erythritol 4-phosphate cytidylyltransferase [Acidihalobacter yilgarnensis]
MNTRCWVIIPAAGTGQRMRAALPKQYLPLLGRSVLEHSLSHFMSRQDIAGIIVALAPDDSYWPALEFLGKSSIRCVAGGPERAVSVRNALRELAQLAAPDDWVLVHDAARPCLRASDLDNLLDTLHEHPIGGILAIPVRDTLKRVSAEGVIADTVVREGLWLAQTPQMFRLAMLAEALDQAFTFGHPVTDEASAMELAGHVPCVVEGHSDNLKITRPEDLPLAEFLLSGLNC